MRARGESAGQHGCPLLVALNSVIICLMQISLPICLLQLAAQLHDRFRLWLCIVDSRALGLRYMAMHSRYPDLRFEQLREDGHS